MASRWTLLEPSIPGPLRRDVLHVRIFQNPTASPFAVKVAPVALPGIVLHHKGRGRAIRAIETPLGRVTRLPLAFVYGAGTTPSTMLYRGGPHVTVQIIFKPQGLRSLLGLDARRLRNGMRPLSGLAGAPSMRALLDDRPPEAKAARLLEFLERMAARSTTRDGLVERALGLVEQHIDDLRLPRILQELDVSERQLERRFTVSVGISPKAYLRIRRFNQALRLMKSRQYPTLASIAYALGFADQSHFIRDLKAFSRVTPKSLSERADHFHEQAGFSYED
jgi:AraC-like DNA-binding protein